MGHVSAHGQEDDGDLIMLLLESRHAVNPVPLGYGRIRSHDLGRELLDGLEQGPPFKIPRWRMLSD